MLLCVCVCGGDCEEIDNKPQVSKMYCILDSVAVGEYAVQLSGRGK